MEHFLKDWGYLAIFALSFISSMALPVGAEVAILYGGVLASGQVPGEGHPLNIVAVILVAAAAEVLGSLAGYAIGNYGGRPLIDKVGKYVLLTHKDLDKAEEWFARRGDPLVLFGRFLPLIRTFVSLAAGLGEMAVGKFVLFTVIGCTVWDAVLAGLGYSLGSSYNHALKDFSDAGYAFAAIAILAILFAFLHRIRAVRSQRNDGTSS